MSDIIDVSKLNEQSRYIDLSKYNSKEVTMTGAYTGDRIVLKGCIDKTVVLQDCIIETTRKEDDRNALVLAEDCRNFVLRGVNSMLVGGLATWGELYNTSILSLRIMYANIAIHMAKDVACSNVLIKDNRIYCALREGVYFGPHEHRRSKANGLFIVSNSFYYCGWDAIQLNAQDAEVYDNHIEHCALTKTQNQDYGITVQKGSLAYIHGNRIIQTPKAIQALDSRVFFHRKPKTRYEEQGMATT